MSDLTNGANVYFERDTTKPTSFVMVHEDIHGSVTTVGYNGDVLSLWTNGKFQGNDAERAAPSEGLRTSLPLRPRFGRAMVVGMGTGTTVGTMAAYPFERVDVAELAPAIVEAARGIFAHDEPSRARRSARARAAQDGRNVLLVGSDKYVVITSSSPAFGSPARPTCTTASFTKSPRSA